MSHEFKDSIKPDVKYCVNCGCLSYKNIPSKTISFSLSNDNIFKMDTLTLKYKPISLKINLTSIHHTNYIAHRKIGLLKIYEISKRFDLIKVITFKAIGFMDKIYLNNANPILIDDIEKIALTCLLLSFQFNNYFIEKNNYYNNSIADFEKNKNNSIINKISNQKNNISECYQYIKSKIKDLMYWQIFCLKNLEFNLSEYTAFDYINLFFKLGIVFTKENIEINNLYNKCINLIEIIINNDKICNYNQYVVALSIINMNLNMEKYFSPNIFKYIYGIDFSRKKYRFCIKEIYEMIIEFYHQNLNIFIVNNKIINTGNKPNNIQLFANLSHFHKNDKRENLLKEEL